MLFDPQSDQSNNEYFDTAVDTTLDDSIITIGQPLTTTFISKLACVPTGKVGCLQVTKTLQQFLDEYPPKTREQAFETIYHALQQLDDYSSDNPKQYTHCMSPDNECCFSHVLLYSQY